MHLTSAFLLFSFLLCFVLPFCFPPCLRFYFSAFLRFSVSASCFATSLLYSFPALLPFSFVLVFILCCFSHLLCSAFVVFRFSTSLLLCFPGLMFFCCVLLSCFSLSISCSVCNFLLFLFSIFSAYLYSFVYSDFKLVLFFSSFTSLRCYYTVVPSTIMLSFVLVFLILSCASHALLCIILL